MILRLPFSLIDFHLYNLTEGKKKKKILMLKFKIKK